ncbi:MAG: ABC transporter permease [Firmicutes bacterium]|nr:ABC transporter permease [Bacillota bacterium]
MKISKAHIWDYTLTACFFLLGSIYLLFTIALLICDFTYIKPEFLHKIIAQEEIRYALKLSLFSSSISAVAALLMAVPIGYILTRYNFRGKSAVEAILDIPIVLPPVVVGLSLLLLFRLMPEKLSFAVIYEVPAVIIAQITVITAFAVRITRAVFEQVNVRYENVAMTLGCTRWQAFVKVLLPQVLPGLISAFTLCWAKALGEFGPILIFAGATRLKTEVLTTSVYLELSTGNIETAVSIALVMILFSSLILFIVRKYGKGLNREAAV